MIPPQFLSAITLALSIILMVMAGCSGCEESTVAGGSTQDDAGSPVDAGVGDGAADDADPVDVADPDSTPTPDAQLDAQPDAPSCPQALSCGDNCCEDGQDCINGECFDPCAGTRCGAALELCCAGQDVCIFDACITPGQACQNTFQCPEGQYCEASLGQCIPEDAIDGTCTYQPPVGDFAPAVEARYEGLDLGGTLYDGSITAPTVADVDQDGKPEIVTVLYRGSLSGAVLVVLNGEDMSVEATGGAENLTPNTAGIAVGNLDTSDPELEIVASKLGGGLIAFDYVPGNADLVELWRNDEGALGTINTEAAISLADLDADGTPEVIMGFSVVDAQGAIFNNINLGPAGGQNSRSANTSVVDLDGQPNADGKLTPEIISGNRAMRADGTMLWDRSADFGDGYTAVGDVDGDGEPEVVTVSSGQIFALSADGQTTIFGPVSIPGGGQGGPPTLADFDGDGRLEIAAAGRGQYTVYDLDCRGSAPDPGTCATQRTDGVLWSAPVQDLSSSRTGSSVFDFEGDGKAEVVYNDECFLRVLDGGTGAVLFEQANSTRTGSEYPIVVDVDADFNAEIVVVANNDQIQRDRCETNFPNYPTGGNAGVVVWGDAQNRWVPTRQIWNQHTYHITNIFDDGSVPDQEPVHYARQLTNSFRLNVQPGGLFNAPDLVIEAVEVRNAACGGAGTSEVAVTVGNQGSLGVAAGAEVEVVATRGADREVIATAQTTRLLLPGQSETLLTAWDAPDDWAQTGFVVEAQADPAARLNECEEQNNLGSADSAPSSGGLVDLEISSLTVDDVRCGSTTNIVVSVDLLNNTAVEVAAGLPVVLEAVNGSSISPITTLRTRDPIASGASATLDYTWQVTADLFGQVFEVRAAIDPAGEFTSCETDRDTSPAECRFGG